MQAPYQIVLNKSDGMIIVRLAGFWDEATLGQFATDVLRELAGLGLPDGQHVALINLDNLAVQSQTVIASIGQLVEHGPNRPRKMAFVVGHEGLARLQFRRLVRPPNIAMFDTDELAKSWLLGDSTMF